MGDYLRQQGFGGGPPSGAPTGINPFAQPHVPINNTYTDLQTSYEPYEDHEEDGGTVPSIPISTPASVTIPVTSPQHNQHHHPPSIDPSAASGGTVPSITPPPTAASSVQFISTTAVPSATGKIGKPENWGANQLGGQPQQQAHISPQDQQQQQQQLPLDSDSLLLPAPNSQQSSSYPFYNIRRYRPYFDVDTNEVLWRVGNSFIGAFSANFMQTTQEKPDLYGPFWICTTLIFITAVSGNFAGYLQWRQNHRDGADPASAVQSQWFTDYTKLSASAGIFYGYVFVVGLLVWLVLRYFRSDMRIVNILCIYGYALSIYLPISVICIAPSDIARWVIVLLGTVTSGLFLFMNLRERIMAAGPGKSMPILLSVLGVHAVVGIVLKLYFFSY
ncbi:hypothetical protein DUNSADRAFT_16981 [Dunaliella salina]|uniref:Protein YIP n=1 Tax=Dunaliella salina TaxID=3046 RepID=A0ABQ7G2L4_DUNSA|nr:hypothetical protein DUNSADRAFT_16981 [Dunaliella salina]|eukprot:KAF5828845.1 hypothetical protein DUNSADRAFT_16981 [Dunaliella salina]